MWERKKILDIVNDESNLANYDDVVDTELQDSDSGMIQVTITKTIRILPYI